MMWFPHNPVQQVLLLISPRALLSWISLITPTGKETSRLCKYFVHSHTTDHWQLGTGILIQHLTLTPLLHLQPSCNALHQPSGHHVLHGSFWDLCFKTSTVRYCSHHHFIHLHGPKVPIMMVSKSVIPLQEHLLNVKFPMGLEVLWKRVSYCKVKSISNSLKNYLYKKLCISKWLLILDQCHSCYS